MIYWMKMKTPQIFCLTNHQSIIVYFGHHVNNILWRSEESPEAETDIDSIIRDDWEEEETNRDPRFMIYWTTIIKTSYTTSYTQTSTIATVICTPSGFGYSGCGKWKRKHKTSNPLRTSFAVQSIFSKFHNSNNVPYSNVLVCKKISNFSQIDLSLLLSCWSRGLPLKRSWPFS